jgi:hypothetical protein
MKAKKRPKEEGAARSEVFAMRMDPKLKYLAGIAARKQRRSIANFVEWAIEAALDKVVLSGPETGGRHATVASEAEALWDIEPGARFLKLVKRFPELLSYEEQSIWRLLNDPSFKDHFARYQKLLSQSAGGSSGWSALTDYAEGRVSKEHVQEHIFNVLKKEYLA